MVGDYAIEIMTRAGHGLSMSSLEHYLLVTKLSKELGIREYNTKELAGIYKELKPTSVIEVDNVLEELKTDYYDSKLSEYPIVKPKEVTTLEGIENFKEGIYQRGHSVDLYITAVPEGVDFRAVIRNGEIHKAYVGTTAKKGDLVLDITDFIRSASTGFGGLRKVDFCELRGRVFLNPRGNEIWGLPKEIPGELLVLWQLYLIKAYGLKNLSGNLTFYISEVYSDDAFYEDRLDDQVVESRNGVYDTPMLLNGTGLVDAAPYDCVSYLIKRVNSKSLESALSRVWGTVEKDFISGYVCDDDLTGGIHMLGGMQGLLVHIEESKREALDRSSSYDEAILLMKPALGIGEYEGEIKKITYKNEFGRLVPHAILDDARSTDVDLYNIGTLEDDAVSIGRKIKYKKNSRCKAEIAY